MIRRRRSPTHSRPRNCSRRPAEAIGWYREAIEAYERDSDRSGEAATRTRLATTLAEAGDPAGARRERELALAIFDDLDPESAVELRNLLANGSP